MTRTNEGVTFRVEPDEWIDIDLLMMMFHPENSQTANAAEDAAIQDSIRRYGFTAEMPILNPWNQRLISGHQRTRNCYALGYRGKLPVVHLRLESEEAHRLAMLQFNLARGHQDPDKHAAELAFLSDTFDPALLATALAKSETDMSHFGDVPTLDELASEYGEHEAEDFWPTIRATVHPETYELYESLMQGAPGAGDHVKFQHLLDCVDVDALSWTDT